jgi:cysteinyl-tRNA synthetase
MRLSDTLTRELVELPGPPAKVRMYFCGPTVYARAHVGNARPFVLGMWLRRWLREQGYDAMLVHNITDVDDKIIAAEGPSAEVAERATRWYVEDVGELGLGLPDALPRATETIEPIIRFIAELVDRELAYEVNGDVYFRVSRDPEYGRLSRQRPDQVEEQEPNPYKEDPRDFALWKANKPGEDLVWQSPWGPGRPGWHIECSVMAEEAFGPEFEIHGGGLDLVFPHHENELAQSRALGHDFARIWAHNGMLEFTGEKMSKSLGNDVSLRNVLDTWGRESLLVFFLSGHWRKPIDFDDDTMAQAEAQVRRIRRAFAGTQWERGGPIPEPAVKALDDDFNTPEALALVHQWVTEGRLDLADPVLTLFGLGSLMEPIDVPADVRMLADLRLEARAAKDWDAADRLRAEIEAAGWEVDDLPEGYVLHPR